MHILEQLGEQRWKDALQTIQQRWPLKGLPEKIEGNEPQFVKEYFAYYKTERGFHPRSINSNSAWTATNPWSFMNMPILNYIKRNCSTSDAFNCRRKCTLKVF